MHFLMGWLKKERFFIFGIFVMSGLLFLCTFLYGESMKPVLLTMQVCGFFFILWCVLSFLSYSKSYTALERTKKELEHSINSLPASKDINEELYQEIIGELHGQYIRLKQKLSEKESEEKDYYTLWVHQIKTPIAAMRLMLQNMDKSERTFQLSSELYKIEQYAGMALQYVRLNERSSDLEIKECNVYELVKQIIKQNKNTFIEKKLSIDFTEFSCATITDEKWLSFIVEQILSNSLKYTKQGGISVKCHEKQNAYVLSFRDTGIGIRESDLPRIFEKGFTGYNGHMDKRSTGIGLYLCKKSADMLGITIQVSSVLHEGTTVSLTIMKDTDKKM